MVNYNPFPVSGQLNDGDKVYLGVHYADSNGVEANSFRYVVYDPSTGDITSHTGTADSETGELTFAGNGQLIIWTYQKAGSSTAAFFTDITGEKKWLYTDKAGITAFSSKLSSTRVSYTTQGLPDLWAGYFGFFNRSDDHNTYARIEPYNSLLIVAIPVVLYDRENMCAEVDNSEGRALSLLIDTYRDNTPNTKVYSTSAEACGSDPPIVYCQNQKVIYSKNYVNGDTRYCGQSLGTKADGTGDDIVSSCMGTCKNYDNKKNNPVCYPGKDNLSLMACTSYSASRKIYGNDDGGNGDNGNGDSGGKPIYAQIWFIVLMAIIGLVVVMIIIVLLFKSNK